MSIPLMGKIVVLLLIVFWSIVIIKTKHEKE